MKLKLPLDCLNLLEEGPSYKLEFFFITPSSSLIFSIHLSSSTNCGLMFLFQRYNHKNKSRVSLFVVNLHMFMLLSYIAIDVELN